MKFFEKFLKFEAKPEDILEYIDAWHSANTEESVYEYLGLTEKEYEIFIRHPEKAESLRSKKFDSVSNLKKALHRLISDK
jgi:hypothetical protein